MASSLKHEVLLRQRAIELIAYWEGRLVTNRLMDWFGISRQQASADIRQYNSEYNPSALVHNPAVKAYVPTENFEPVLTQGLISEYMDLVSGQGDKPTDLVLETHPNLCAVQLPERAVRPEVVREVIKACRAGTSVRIQYASMANPETHDREISPHTLVYSGFRWHVRAFCHQRAAFRDFLLSRITGLPVSGRQLAPAREQDQYWMEQVELRLIPNSNLNTAQRALIERDYAMQSGLLRLKVRKALAHYTLVRYQAALSDLDAKRVGDYPLQLVPEDRPLVEPLLFNSERE